MFIRKFGILIFTFLGFSLQAQLKDQAYLSEYKRAIQFYADGNYDQAIAKLVPLSDPMYTNPMVPYSVFYHGLALKGKSNVPTLCQNVFKELLQRYPTWEKVDDVRLIYAEICFKENKYADGIKELYNIQSEKHLKTKDGMIATYVSKIKNLNTLKDLNRKYADDKFIAEALYTNIQKNKSTSSVDLELVESLSNKFGFEKIEPTPIKKEVAPVIETSKVETAKIYSKSSNVSLALLFPFDFEKNSKSLESNRYVYDLYMGLKLAKKHLEVEGINLSLHAFDIGKDKGQFLALETLPNLNKVNAIIGPLYAGSNSAVEKFSQTNKIIQIHPTSTNKNLIETNPYAFLASPSVQTQAEVGFKAIANTSTSKQVSIYFGSNKKDSLLAIAYKAVLQKEGYIVKSFQNFEKLGLKTESQPGHYFFSGEDELATKFIQQLQLTTTTTPVIIFGDNEKMKSLEKAIVSSIVFYACPEYYDTRTELSKSFFKSFVDYSAVTPSFYAYRGYNLGLFLGRRLTEKKDINFQFSGTMPSENILSPGFEYSVKGRENRSMSILKFVGEEFQLQDN
ncbi:MAG: hypothetical protein ACRCVT_05515 [Leadbetterella sp.]